MFDTIALPTRRWLLAIAVIAVFVSTSTQADAADRKDKPNIIVILTDDHGYNDVGFNGSKEIPTPNLDALAADGVICTNGYVTCPVCAPTRAGLLTGRYQQRSGFEDNSWNRNAGLSPDVPTMPGYLKDAGYKTFAIGKWHVGQLPQFRPLVRGFTDHYGFLGGGRSFFPKQDSVGVAFVPKDPDMVDLWRNEERVDDPPYLTTAFGDAAVDYIDQHKDEPFFIYLAFNAPHLPYQAPKEYLDRVSHIEPELRRTYAAMIVATDDAVGRVTKKLRDEGLEEETLIFFLSDNGGAGFANASDNSPLRDYKGSIYEGGVRVPFVVKWTGRLPAGKKYDKPVFSLDIMATALAAAGIEAPTDKDRRPDGVDIVPYLSGEKDGRPHETIYWRFVQDRAIRHGDWKLTMPEDEDVELFDLSKDISESNDLKDEHPEIVEKLKNLYAKWEAELPPPQRSRPRDRQQRQQRRQQRLQQQLRQQQQTSPAQAG